LSVSLDARVERPETRTFKNPDPIEVVRDNRAKYVAAALTILRAYHVAGRPQMPNTPLGSFEVWSRWVRDALIWLGEPDPCKTMERIRIEDPRLKELAAVLGYWKSAIGERPVTVKELIDMATDRYVPSSHGVDLNGSDFMHPDFREALLVVGGDGGFINSRRLGNWLSKHKAKVVGNLRLVPATMQRGENRWKVEPA
jgi:putative DNA primase/helicase